MHKVASRNLFRSYIDTDWGTVEDAVFFWQNKFFPEEIVSRSLVVSKSRFRKANKLSRDVTEDVPVVPQVRTEVYRATCQTTQFHMTINAVIMSDINFILLNRRSTIFSSLERKDTRL